MRGMKVPLLDLKPQYQALKSEIDAAIAQVCDNQHFILGPAVRQLESGVAAYSQCARGVGVSSGTDALLLALMALDIGVGDEVITSSYTFFATGGAIARSGARPVFLDIDPLTFNLSPVFVRQFLEQQCERRDGVCVNRATGGKVRALMPVHLYGQLADMAALMPLARDFGLKVVEDSAQAIGSADSAGRRACSFGDTGCLSFFPTKNLGAFGDAGMCVTSDEALAQRMKILRVHGMEPKYYHSEIGGNFRLDELQAAVLNVKLKALDSWTAGRQRNASYYTGAFALAGLADRVTTPHAVPGSRHIYNQYVIRVPQRDALRKHLADAGVGAEVYYPVPLHQQKCFEYLGYHDGQLPESERAACETLALPVYSELETEQLQFVVTTIAAFYNH